MKVSVFVKPRSKKGPLITNKGGLLTVYVQQPALDGKANDAVRKLIAEHYGVSVATVRCIGGKTSRHKTFELTM